MGKVIFKCLIKKNYTYFPGNKYFNHAKKRIAKDGSPKNPALLNTVNSTAISKCFAVSVTEINDVLNKPGHGHKLKTSKTLRRKIVEDVRHYPVISLKMTVAELALSELNVSKKAVVHALHPSGHWGIAQG